MSILTARFGAAIDDWSHRGVDSIAMFEQVVGVRVDKVLTTKRTTEVCHAEKKKKKRLRPTITALGR